MQLHLFRTIYDLAHSPMILAIRWVEKIIYLFNLIISGQGKKVYIISDRIACIKIKTLGKSLTKY